MELWNVEDVQKFLGTWGFARLRAEFKAKAIDGKALIKLDFNDLHMLSRDLEKNKRVELLYRISYTNNTIKAGAL
jgi:hypothetical protein